MQPKIFIFLIENNPSNTNCVTTGQKETYRSTCFSIESKVNKKKTSKEIEYYLSFPTMLLF